MKIIYLANARIPTEKAHGLQIMKMCQAFQGAGLKVELVAAKRINQQFKGVDVFDYYKISTKFPIKRLWLLDLVDWSCPLRGLLVFVQNSSFALSAFFELLFKKANIIYSRDEFSLFLLSFFKKNLVLELHTFPRSKFFLYKWLFRRIRKIIVINNKLKELVIGLGIKPSKILVAHDGVDLEQFDVEKSKEQCRQELDLPLDKKLIIYTGQLFKWKGVYVLAKASQFLEDDCQIIFVGGMEDDIKKLKAQSSKLKTKNILFVGHRPPAEIPYWLKSADVLILPNSSKEKISKLYTSPIKMFEYMASGAPIVASNLPSLREILNENNAILVKPDSSEHLVQGINTILKEADFSAKIAEQAYQDVQKYTWQKRAKNIINFIN